MENSDYIDRLFFARTEESLYNRTQFPVTLSESNICSRKNYSDISRKAGLRCSRGATGSRSRKCAARFIRLAKESPSSAPSTVNAVESTSADMQLSWRTVAEARLWRTG